MAIGGEYDTKIIKLLGLSEMSTTRLAKELGVDDGGLTRHLINDLVKTGFIEVVDADGSTPVWDLTDEGRRYLDTFGYP